MKFIKDEEIELTDNNDLLNGRSYAQALQNAISAGAPNKEAFVIGLFGEWGSGKSSIIKTTQSLLQKDKKNKIKFITYDAWKYAQDSFRRMFLFQIQKNLGFNRNSLMERFYSNTSEDVKFKTTFNPTKFKFWGIPVIFFIIAIISNFWQSVTAQTIQSASFFISAITLFFGSCHYFFENLKITKNTPLLFAPEQFEECFDEMIDYALTKRSLFTRTLKWIIQDSRKSNFDKIVIVIDNIDRCDSKTAYELLTTLKSFLLKNPKLVFVIPTDDQMLCDHLSRCFNYSHQLSENFFRKIFNVEIRIKPLEDIELFDFTNKLNKNYELGFSPDAINIVANEFATNPRRIIQFFNNVKLELEILRKKLTDTELTQAQNIVCKLLIIREEWPAYYKLILKNSRLLNAADFDNKNNALELNPKELQTLKIFLKQTNAFQITNDDNLIDKIISNSAVFNELPIDIKNSIKELNETKMSTFISQADTNLDLIVNYIEEELQKNIVRQTWQTSVPNFFNALLLVNNIKTIPVFLNDRIHRVIKHTIVNFIMNLDLNDGNNIKLFVTYLNDLISQNKCYLINEINEFLSAHIKQDAQINQIYLWLYEQLITGIKDKSVFSKDKQLFVKWYTESESTIKGLKLTDLNNFVSSELLSYIIEQMEKDNDVFLNDFVYIGVHVTIANEHFNNVFKKLNSFYSSYTNSENDLISERIDKIMPVLSILKANENLTELETFVKNIFTEYNKPIRNNYYSTQTLTFSLIKDNLENENLRTKVIKLLALIYKSTNNQIQTLPYFNEISAQYPDSLDQILNTLRSENIDPKNNIAPIKNIVLNKSLFTDNYVYWLKRLTDRTYTTGGHVLSDEELSTEIANIIHEIGQTDNEQERANLNELLDFIYDKCEKTKVTQAVIDSLKTEGKDTIIKLSETIRPLTLSKICENIPDYKDSKDILQSIAIHGNKENIKKLMVFIRSEVAKDDTKSEMIELYNMIPQDKLSKSDQDKMEPYLQELEVDLES